MTNTPGSRSETLPVMERTDPYVDWRDAEGVPVTGGYYVEDMAAVPMAPWPRKGGRGGILNLDPIGRKDVHVVELAPAANLGGTRRQTQTGRRSGGAVHSSPTVPGPAQHKSARGWTAASPQLGHGPGRPEERTGLPLSSPSWVESFNPGGN